MAIVDKTFQDLVTNIVAKGYWYDDPYRKGVRRKELATYTFKHDLTKEFPAMTTKSLYWKGVVGELIWFLRGWDNIKYLEENKITIWRKDAYKLYQKNGGNLSMENWILQVKGIDPNGKNFGQPTNIGTIGPGYGVQWRNWIGGENPDIGEDQIRNLITGMIERPLATDLIVTAWNPSELHLMALPPCHFGFQIVGRPLTQIEQNEFAKKHLAEYLVGGAPNIPKYGFTLVWDQRSVDTFLGLPFNIASYALLAHILGKITNMVPLEIVGNLRNVHIYDNAMDTIKEQLMRDETKFKGAQLTIKDRPEYDRLLKGRCALDNFLSNLEISDFKLEGYDSYPPLKVEMLARD